MTINEALSIDRAARSTEVLELLDLLLPPPRARQLVDTVWLGGVPARRFKLPPNLFVIVSIERHGNDSRAWLHASVSLQGKVREREPKWKHLVRVRREFFTPEMEVLQIFPPAGEYVNLCEVLHFWASLSGRLTPG